MRFVNTEAKAYSGTNANAFTEQLDLVDRDGNVLKRYSKAASGELSESVQSYTAPVARVVTGTIDTALSGEPVALRFGNLSITTVASGEGIPDDDDGTELIPYLIANAHLIPADNVVDNEDQSFTITMLPGANALPFTSADAALTFAEDTAGADAVTSLTSDIDAAVINDATLNEPVITNPASTSTGTMITKMGVFTENATNTSHVCTIAIPAGAILHRIMVVPRALWAAGAAVMKVGDTADDDGYFVGVDLKATDLLVGEVLDTISSSSWGGKEGAYLVAASGQRGPTSTNFGTYYAAGSNILGTITVTTPGSTQGRTYLAVTYSVGENVAAVASGT